MTLAQHKRFYFPAWLACCKANGWRMDRGRLILEEARLNEHGAKVVAAANAIAAGEHRALLLDDLRHGAHVVALGRDKSSTRFDNKEVDRVVSFFRLMMNDTDLAAVMQMENPEIGERKRLVIRINALKIPDAVVDGVCKRAFAPVYHGFFEDLPILNLRALAGILTEIKERKVDTNFTNQRELEKV